MLDLSADEIATRFLQSDTGHDFMTGRPERLDHCLAEWIRVDLCDEGESISRDAFEEAYDLVRGRLEIRW